MGPSRSLNQQIFSRLDQITYRNLSTTYNPLEIPEIPYVDFSNPMDFLISQDCSGFNLGSFLVRRSEFTRRVLDMWWDPIFYEQKYLPSSALGSQADVDIWIGIIKNKMHLNICTLRNPLFEVVSAFFLNERLIRFRRVLAMAMKIDKISSTVKRNVTF
jgi:hypothetical protein